MADYGDDDRPPSSLITTPLIAGWICGGIPFVFSYRSSSSVSVNGEVVGSSSTDYVALPLGAVAIVFGIVALVAAAKASDRKPARFGLAATVLLVGTYQLLRGIGML